MNKKMYVIVFGKYLDNGSFGSIVPRRRFEFKEDAKRYCEYLYKTATKIYPIFKKYCSSKVAKGNFHGFELGWNMPRYILENISVAELEILHWICFSLYCYNKSIQNINIDHDAVYSFAIV